MATKVYSVAEIREKLETNNEWLVRGILAIYARQTSDERLAGATTHDNGMGFNGRDANFLSSLATQIKTWQATAPENRRYPTPLSGPQFNSARRAMKKYAGQLAKIAAERTPVAAEVAKSEIVQQVARAKSLPVVDLPVADTGVDVEAWDEMQAELDAERNAIMAVERGEYVEEMSW